MTEQAAHAVLVFSLFYTFFKLLAGGGLWKQGPHKGPKTKQGCKAQAL